MGSDTSILRLGILGGGQLARMIAQATLRAGHRPVVLAGSQDEPAAIEGVEWVPGTLHDRGALEALFGRSDLVTIENEFLDVALMRDVMGKHPGVPLAPGLASIAIAQDKLAQKELFTRIGLASPPWEQVDTGALESEIPRLHQRFPGGFMLKLARFGYDGRGNLPMRSDAPTPDVEVARFFRAAEAAGSPVYAEAFVNFEMELAMVSARTRDGQQVCFPLVDSAQERGICREVTGPAVLLGRASALERQAEDAIRRVAEALDFVGVLAIEFFLDQDGGLLINEMAPRVHNSGHYTLYGGESSQFDLHVQAVTGTPLDTPSVRGLAAMRNILGPHGLAPGLPCAPPTLELPEGIELHWYGKRTVSAGRKMGHLTARATTARELEASMAAMRAWEERLWKDSGALHQAG